MPLPFEDDQWTALLDCMEQGAVIPLVGEGAVTFGRDDKPLYPWLAEELAQSLGVNSEEINGPLTVSAVAQRHVKNGNDRNRIYSQLNRILKKPEITPGQALRDLALIEAFQLFVTTTFDPLLAQAVNQERYGSEAGAQVAAFSPNAAARDLPARVDKLSAVTVYHLLGKVAAMPGQFVACEEDLLDFLAELPRHLGMDTMRNISADLKSNNLLAIGLNFSDWIVRLLFRIARQDSLSRVASYSWLAGGMGESASKSMVVFFSGVRASVNVIECDPPAFVAELARRWRERYPACAPVKNGAPAAIINALARSVFLSYAREDQIAALRIKKDLEAAGCSVYFDKEALGGGTDFKQELQKQVSELCAVFVSVISPHTEEAKGDHFFQRERNWATERAKGYKRAQIPEFYLPFVIHAEIPAELEPQDEIFRHLQWNHCPGGAVAPDLAQRVAAFQKKFASQL